jgi:hypothetical protein
MQAYLSFDKIFEGTEFQLGSGGGETGVEGDAVALLPHRKLCPFFKPLCQAVMKRNQELFHPLMQ